MITVQLKQGDLTGSVTCIGDELTEPCEITVSGDFTLKEIQSMFWLVTLTAEGNGQGIYAMDSNVCSPAELLRVLLLSNVEVSGIPQEWTDGMEQLTADADEEFAQGSAS